MKKFSSDIKIKTRKALFVIIFSILNIFSSFSQNFSLRFERISILEGLSQSSINTIWQDSKGFLWFGTMDGLNKYDGYKFTLYSYNPFNPNSINGNWVNSIAEDIFGNLFIAVGTKGIDRLDIRTAKFTHFRYNPKDPNSISHDNAWVVFRDKSGVIWVGTDNGLNEYDYQTAKFKHYFPGPETPETNKSIHSIHEDRYGNLWIGTNAGLNKFDRMTKKFTFFKLGYKESGWKSTNRVWSIDEDHMGFLWIGTYYGLVRFGISDFSVKIFKHDPKNPNSLSNIDVKTICFEPNTKTVWITTYGGGLNILDPITERFTHIKHNPYDLSSLSSNNLKSMFIDKTGIIWIGAEIGGLNKYDPKKEKFHHFKQDKLDPNSLNSNIVFSFFENDENILWIGTWDGGLNKFDRKNNRFTHYLHKPYNDNSIAGNLVWSIIQDKEGFLWICTWGGGLDKFNPKTNKFTHYRFKEKDPGTISDNFVHTVYEDRKGTIWCGTEESGLNKLDKKRNKFTRYRYDSLKSNGISSDLISVIFEDNNNTIWIGTSGGGINKFDRANERFKSYKNNPLDLHSISNDHIRCIHEDKSGFLWIGTLSGLNKFDKEKEIFTHFTEKDGLPNNVIYGILEDDHENLWISTNKGISKFNPKENTYRNYTVNDGLQSNEFNQNSYFKNKKGEMIFGGINGFNIFHPDSIRENPFTPPIVITSFKKFDKSVLVDYPYFGLNELILSYDVNFITFEFAALDYSNPLVNQYAYYLEGFDKKWNYCGNRNFANYTNLSGGEYIFHVKGSNNDKVWNEKGTSLKLIIIPPFWQTPGFFIFVIILVIIITIWLYYQRVKYISKQKEILEVLINQRTYELKQKTEDLEKINSIVNSINMEIDFIKLLNSILEQIQTIKGIQRSLAITLDREINLFTIVLCTGWKNYQMNEIQLTTPEIESLFIENSTEIFPDIFLSGNSNNVNHPEKYNWLKKAKSRIVIRIRVDDKPEGYLIFDNLDYANVFKKEDLELLNYLKSNIISAYSKAKMVEELKKLNESKNLFFGMIAHDLMNPLSVISSYKDLLYDDLRSGNLNLKESTEFLEEMSQAIFRMKYLLTDLLDISAIESGQMQVNLRKNDLASIIMGSIEFYNRAARKKNIDLSIKEIDSLPILFIDKERITEVMDNLISNAIKYTYPGGKISISIKNDGKNAIISVKDNGQGLAENDLKKVFRSYKKLSATPTGDEPSAGLGLAIVKKIIDLHSGKVKVESKKGEGSIFSFSIPIT